jgi:Rad3-related DNA helicase
MQIPFQNFSKFRPYQEQAIDAILKSRKKVFILSAPTGSGKTLIGMMAGSFQPSCTYVCTTKYLQEQVTRDFPEAVRLYGRNNYPCLRRKELRADLCSHTRLSPCRYKKKCSYEVAKDRTLKAKYRILNFAYFLTEANYIGKFSDQDFLIVDEGDTIESQLLRFFDLKFSLKQLDYYNLGRPRHYTSYEDWKAWAERAEDIVLQRIKTLENIDTELSSNEEAREHIKEYNDYKTLYNKINMLTDYVDDTWLIGGSKERGYEFKPVWLNPQITEKYLLSHAKRILTMSATFLPPRVFSITTGIPFSDIEYLELPSTFPPENRSVYFCPAGDMSRKTYKENLPAIVSSVKSILKKHKKEKGIIHTVSYKLAQEIITRLNDLRLVFHDTDNKQECIDNFFTSSDSLVLVSPYIYRGLSLDDDAGRFAIWLKVPYLDLSDAQVSARLYGKNPIGKYWYLASAAITIVQGAGRIVRNENDYGETWILDSQFARLMETPDLFPGWFRDAVWRVKEVQ